MALVGKRCPSNPKGATMPSSARWESMTDVPLMVLAVATIPLLVVEANATAPWTTAAAIANWTIWACFATDLAVRTAQARGQWRRYLLTHWYDVAIVGVTVIPYLLPIRALRSMHAIRILRAARVIVYAVRVWHTAIRIWQGLIGRQMIVAMPVVVTAGATGIWFAESGTNSTLGNFGDALWWAMVTVTTVGYGDIAPVTAAGRVIAAALMVVGIALFGIVTANIASNLTQHSPPDQAT